jgi:serine/threonine protein kinase
VKIKLVLPVDDLNSKTPWLTWEQHYGSEIQYIFGYAVVRSQSSIWFDFGISSKEKKKIVSLIKVDLRLPEGCARFLAFWIRLLPVFKELAARLRSLKSLPLSGEVYSKRDRERKIMKTFSQEIIGGTTCFAKKWRFDDVAAAAVFLGRMEEVYKVLSSIATNPVNHHAPPFFVPCYSIYYCIAIESGTIDHNCLKVACQPFGRPISQVAFDTIDVVIQLAIDIAEQLVILKSHNLLHNDIRLENIILDISSNRFILVDYDECRILSAENPFCEGLPHLAPSNHPAQIHEQHSFEVDIKSLMRFNV